MSTTVTLNRGEVSAIPFSITDAGNSLLGKRVTWSLSVYPYVSPPPSPAIVLKKVSGLGVSTADITISTIAAGTITGFVNIALADFAKLTDAKYLASLWVDDGSGNDRCVTVGGMDLVKVTPTTPRA